jgi:hypothetical protein
MPQAVCLRTVEVDPGAGLEWTGEIEAGSGTLWQSSLLT